MCEKPATTREHAPPLSFFPAGRRENLITVPSCNTHNNDNSQNVEYVRNIIVTDIHTNEVGREMFAAKVQRSYARGDKLRNTTFKKIREVTLSDYRMMVQAGGFRIYYHERVVSPKHLPILSLLKYPQGTEYAVNIAISKPKLVFDLLSRESGISS
jgi:hypothetical protein